MKITVTVDLSEMYSEEDGGSFSQEIKQEIARQIKREVLADFKSKCGDVFTAEVVKKIDKAKVKFIENTLKKLVVDEKIKKRYSTDEMISISDYLKDELERTYINDRTVKDFFDKQVSQTTKNLSEELKKRYDMLFASQIVSKLHENGMLREDVAKLLLPKE